MSIPAVILAGGRSSRMGGGDKTLLHIGNVTLLARIVTILGPQANPILLNSNSDPQLFAASGLDVRPDCLPGRLGPLAGILTALMWARDIGVADVLTVPCDTPFLPRDLLRRLLDARIDDHAVIASSGSRIHPVIGVWPVALAAQLHRNLESGLRRVRDWLSGISFSTAEFEAVTFDPFWNVNTKDDLEKASRGNPRIV